jgi:Zn-dependent metalloprotease
MSHARYALPLLLVLSAPLCADQPLSAAEAESVLSRYQALRWSLGLDQQDDFIVRSAFSDGLGQRHVRFQQTYREVPVFGGEAIAHEGPGGVALPLTDSLCRGIQLEVLPQLTPAEALGVADRELRPSGPYAYPPTVERVVWPVQPRPAGQRQTYVLAYHVHTQLENGVRETAHTDFLIDAHTGGILKQWDSLRTKEALADGLTQYSGTVKLNVNTTPKGLELRDLTRGKGGTFGNNVVTNLDHGSSGQGEICATTGSTWGNHANYSRNDLPTNGLTGQTAMADAAYGTQVAWDMFKHVFGRDGIDGTGKATYGRVHYSSSYDNAFWDDSCFCMTYGDGSRFKSLEALDVTGHELAHGICSSSANLTYNGESGGLNEANSDIFGTLTEFYGKGGGYAAGADTLPGTGGNWTIGEQIGGKPLRYMYKPSKDGRSPDVWSAGLGELNVHYSSGPMNRCFFFLSHGASATPGDHYSELLPSGMQGLGNQEAARIWYRALTTYLTSGSDYAAARAAALRAATDLHGAGSAAAKAVCRAFHGINVGLDWSPVTAVILQPAGDQVIVTGTELAFAGAATDVAPGTSLSYGWTFGDGGVAVGTAAAHTFHNQGRLDQVCTVTFNALDDQGNLGTDSRTVTVTAPISVRPERIRNGGFEEGPSAWEGDTAVIGHWDSQAPYSGQNNALFTGIGFPAEQKLQQAVAIPGSASAATLSFRRHIDSNQLLPVAADFLRVQVLDAKGGLLRELAAFSNLDANSGYALESYDLSAFAGQPIRLGFLVNEGWIFHTNFAVDEVSLIVR